MRGTVAGWMVVAVAAVLSACGNGEQAREAPRPVLVTQASADAQAGLSTFAGEVHAREESPLSFRIGGNLIRRNVDAGARVRRGDVLAVLDPGDLSLQAQAAQAQLAAAEADLVRTRGDRDRYAKLVAQKLVSQSAFDAQVAAYKAAEGQARAARAQLDVARNQAAYAQLRAPRDGVIASRQVEAGQVVAAGQTVFTLAADGGREVIVALPEARIREFRVGQPAQVELWNAPGQYLPARIREMAPAADAQTRTYQARVALDPGAAASVDLGQSARVHVQAEGTDAALSVPLSAVQRSGKGAASVWVVDPKTATLRLQPVQLGPYGENSVPVLKGVAASDWIVAAGGHLLREGQAVVAVDRSNKPVMQPPAAKPE